MTGAFLGNYASISKVDLIQLKKLDFGNFYESNCYRSIRIMTVSYFYVILMLSNHPRIYSSGLLWRPTTTP